MRRFAFQTAVITHDGLYSYQGLSLEQAQAWVAEEPEPAFRMPLIGSVISALSGREMSVRPHERLFMHTDDEALIVLFEFPEDEHKPAYKRGRVATQARSLSLADVREHVRFSLLKKFARLDAYTRSITQWDAGHRGGGRRYLVHAAVLLQHGIYEFTRIDVPEALTWLDEGRYESQLRYDATCKALELLSDSDFTMWESNSQARLLLRPGDQALIAFLHPPGEERPKPFEPFHGELTRNYVLGHTSLNLLTRLSDEFILRNFPSAQMTPTERGVG